MSDSADSQELKNILGRINRGLKELLPVVKDTKTQDAVARLERLSRWKERKFSDNPEATQFAIERAEQRLKEEGRAFVVAQSKEKLVLVEKCRFYTEHPFGLQDEDVIYDTGSGQKGTE